MKIENRKFRNEQEYLGIYKEEKRKKHPNDDK